METLARITSSLGWSYFWMAFTAFFAVFDILTGSFLFAGLQIVLFMFFLADYRKKVNGTHTGYNLYHGEKV